MVTAKSSPVVTTCCRGGKYATPAYDSLVPAMVAPERHVETTRIGGKVVWMQPLFGNMRVYYAHLNEQWVQPGDFVLAGYSESAANGGIVDLDAGSPDAG